MKNPVNILKAFMCQIARSPFIGKDIVDKKKLV